jgi:hypothetical protein
VKAAYLWDRYAERYASVKTAVDLYDALRYLIDSGFYQVRWWATRLEKVCEIGIDDMRIYWIRDKLIELSEADPGGAIAILRMVVSNGHTNGAPRYLVRKISVPILANAIQYGDDGVQKTAREVMSKLGRLGLTDLDELVEEYVKDNSSPETGRNLHAVSHLSAL